MLSLKFLIRCCCDNAERKEEDQGEKLPKFKMEQKKTTFYQSINDSEGKNLEENINAAPFPQNGVDPISYPKLFLQILESTKIDPGTILTITATGLQNSKRNKSDFKTYIGSQLQDKGEVLNDFVIPEESDGMGKQHLLIKFNTSTNKYLISDLGDGSGTFVKLDTDILLRNEYIISFGNSHMKISLNSISDKLGVKFIEGPKTAEEFFFAPSDEVVLIGRMNDCRVRFEDSNMSRYQCSILYQQTRGWVLRDGINSKRSTNGTWIYVEEEFEIEDKMVFKAGKTLFEANLQVN